MPTSKEIRRIAEYLKKYDLNMKLRDNSVSLGQAERLDDNFKKIYHEYKDIQHLFWSFDMARNIVKHYRKKLLLI